MKQETDKKILDLIKLAKSKKESIQRIERANWKTNCSFAYDPISPSRINIQVISDVNILVSILGYIIGKSEDFEKATNALVELKVKTKFDWMGFSLEDWKNDIQTRVNKIQVSNEKSELESIEKRLSDLISPELRAQIELENIEKLLNY